jgi:hypothetical protein
MVYLSRHNFIDAAMRLLLYLPSLER